LNFIESQADRIQRVILYHPVQMIEGLEIQWYRVPTESLFSLNVEELLEIRHHQLTQCPVNRLPVPQTDKVRLGHSTPMPIPLKDSQEMIIIPLIRQQVNNEWRVPNRLRAAAANRAPSKQWACRWRKTVRGQLYSTLPL